MCGCWISFWDSKLEVGLGTVWIGAEGEATGALLLDEKNLEKTILIEYVGKS